MKRNQQQQREEKKLETKITEDEKNKIIGLVSKARSLFINKNTKSDELKDLLDEIKPYASMGKTNEHYLFSIIGYHYDRLRKEFKEKTGIRYK